MNYPLSNIEDAVTRRHGDTERTSRVSPRPRVPASLSRRHGGFSFTEILFAIMILGIGFIMVAAMFPVAIQQTENSNQETVGAAIARGGVGYVQQVANTTFVPNLPAATETLGFLRPTLFFPAASPPVRS